MDDRDPKVWAVLAKALYGKLFADREYISPKLFEMLFEDGIHLVTGIMSDKEKAVYRKIGDVLGFDILKDFDKNGMIESGDRVYSV